jgi:hypothetical protein
MVKSAKFVTSIVFCKLSRNGCLPAIALPDPSIYLFRESFDVPNAPVKTLLGKGRKFNFRHIQPAGFLGCINYLEAL